MKLVNCDLVPVHVCVVGNYVQQTLLELQSDTRIMLTKEVYTLSFRSETYSFY